MVTRRIQRRRNPGWRMPTGAVYVGRPTKWGNPHHVTPAVTAYLAVTRYAQDLNDGANANPATTKQGDPT